jgi:hypothetical protein
MAVTLAPSIVFVGVLTSNYPGLFGFVRAVSVRNPYKANAWGSC